MPGMLVEVALGPLVPPVVVEREAPDEVPPAVARRLPASGQGLGGSLPMAPMLEVEEPLLRLERDPPGLLEHPSKGISQ